MTKIKVVSDLHLEFSGFEIDNSEQADILVLAGDIMVADDLTIFPFDSPWLDSSIDLVNSSQKGAKAYRNFFDHVSKLFKHVVYVAGNHEFYHGEFYNSLKILRENVNQYSNVYFLEREHITIDDLTIVGGTMWTDMHNSDPQAMLIAKYQLNDYRCIRNDQNNYHAIEPEETIERFNKTINYFETVIEQSEKVLVVSHHAPSLMSTDPQYNYELQYAYANNLDDFILNHPQIKLWCHGHIHTFKDYMIGTTRVICNPRGYHTDKHSQTTGFNPDLILEI